MIYDFPRSIRYAAGVFYAGGQISEGGITAGGISVGSAEPGGRAFLRVQPAPQRSGSLDSWFISMAAKRTVFRLPIYNSRQLVRPSDLGVTPPDDAYCDGIMWSNDQPWANGSGWEYELLASAYAALEGSTVIKLSMNQYEPGLSAGHVIGLAGRAYLAEWVEYTGSIATVTISPPLRANANTGDLVTFRPTMFGVVQNPESLREMYQRGRLLNMGEITFVEALV